MGEQSQGRLQIQFYNPNSLCPNNQTYASTVAGAVDIGAVGTIWNVGKFNLAEIIELPFLFNGAESASLTMWELYNRFPEWREEYKEVKMLWQWASALFQLHTVKKPVRTLEDLKGMKLISWSASMNNLIRMLGANAIDGKPTDTYLALERGMADGVFCPLAPLRSFKISDAAKHHTIINLNAAGFWAGMNQAKWNSLPPDLQKLISESTGEKMAQLAGKTLDEGRYPGFKMDEGEQAQLLCAEPGGEGEMECEAPTRHRGMVQEDGREGVQERQGNPQDDREPGQAVQRKDQRRLCGMRKSLSSGGILAFSRERYPCPVPPDGRGRRAGMDKAPLIQR